MVTATRHPRTPAGSQRARLDEGRVIEAAERVVDRDGWDGLTMTVLARELAIRTPSLYNHVDGLDAVRALLQRRVLTQLGTELRDAALGRSREDGLRTLAHVYRDFARRHPGRYTALSRQMPEEATGEAEAHALEALAAILRSFGLSDAEQQDALVPLWSTVHGFVTLELNGAFPPGTDAEAAYERTLDGVLRVVELFVESSRSNPPTPRRTRT
ncbi:MAG: WHG domain-containing protein [Acidimicrobiales bacterium]|nr:WHG domain-containing protein [Acidimicrobiales bacterium]